MQGDFAADVAAISRIDVVPLILEVVCRSTGMRFAAVARVTEDRWIACAVRDEIAFGLTPGGELKVETTICDQIRQSGDLVVIDHVAEDNSFCRHPTPAMYGFQSYISVPIRLPDGRFFGTLCAIDPKPARVNTPQVVGMFKLFANLIALHLDSEARLAASAAALSHERQTAELREQFIAVLGHDLRNPIASIDAGTRLLARQMPDEKAASIIGLIRNSVARMSGLIDNILDFARGRLGGGLPVDLVADADLPAALEQVVHELQSVWPDRVVQNDIALARPVVCDRARIAQMLSNLLANALTHGDGGAVTVQARSDDAIFSLSVVNRGEPLAAGTVARLFQPFSRTSGQSGQPGLGLGLYIASEIARAHGGTIKATSSADETRFTFTMPNRATV